MSEEDNIPTEDINKDDPAEDPPEDDSKPDEEDDSSKDDEEDDDINPDDYDPEVRKEAKKDEDEDEDDDLDPDDKKTISKVIDKRLSPVEQQIQRQNDEIEINNYLVENPEMSKYKPVMLKYLQHPAYSNIPVKNIAAMVASKDMQKLGAKKEREASRKANETRQRGSQANNSKPVDWLTAPKKDFEAELQRVKTQPRD